MLQERRWHRAYFGRIGAHPFIGLVSDTLFEFAKFLQQLVVIRCLDLFRVAEVHDRVLQLSHSDTAKALAHGLGVVVLVSEGVTSHATA